MSGTLRWRDIQNINTTEDQVNLLAGLTAVAADINRITGYLYGGTELNAAAESVSTLNNHVGKSLALAHPITPSSIDGGVLADNTVAKAKLAFNPLTDEDFLTLDNKINVNDSSILGVQSQIENLYSIVIPGQAEGIANSIAKMVDHVEREKDAHDATSISFGNQYDATLDLPSGSTQTRVSIEDARFIQKGDTIALQDVNGGPEEQTVNFVNYDTGHIELSTPAILSYVVANSFVVHVRSQDNVQEAIHRSLRNTTDILTGRLTIEQETDDDALVINNTGAGYTARFNNFTGKTEGDYSLELGENDGSSQFRIENSDKRLAFSVLDDGSVWLSDILFEDRETGSVGVMSHQRLTAEKSWILPDRSGYVGLGDTSFSELLKVSQVTGTKSIKIAPGYMKDYEGQIVSTWISMENPCRFDGGTTDIEARMAGEGQLLPLASQWQVVTIYINDTDTVGFFYGPQETTEQEAIDNYENYIPSAYMKLTKLIVQGDGVGGLLTSSIRILEDQRPFLTMGLSAAYYDETIIMSEGADPGDVLNLPPNTKGGGTQITYRPGKSQLEIYVDGVYQRAGIDFEEYQGEPVAKVRLLKGLNDYSQVRFRITFKAAAVAGGIETESLQTVYQNGPMIGLSSIYGPIQMFGYDMDTLLDIDGDVIIKGLLRGIDALEFDPQSIMPGDTNTNKIFTDINSKLIFHQFKSGVAKNIDILQEIENAKNSVIIEVNNLTGTTIASDRGVALHPSLTNHVVLCDTSNKLSTSRLLGVTLENIPSSGKGRIVLAGVKSGTALTIPHGKVVVVDPRNPGMMVEKESVTLLPEDQYMEVGAMNGGSLVVDIDRNQKDDTAWSSRKAGQVFVANETKVVRLAVGGETRGAVYSAEIADANVDQKFWALAAVHPSRDTSELETVDLYKEVELSATETPFEDQDIGKPLFLGPNGTFKPWRLIKNTFSLGDAMVKIGIIEDRRKFILDGSQMMGTANGPMV